MEAVRPEPPLTGHAVARSQTLYSRNAARQRGATGWSRRTPLPRGLPAGQREEASATGQAEDLWERHGRSAYAIGCVLLGDAAAAARAVELGMADFVQSTGRVSASDARRSIARHIYRRSQELSVDTSRTLRMPPAMVWISQLAQQQRACLALCLFGGHTHREAAALLGVPPTTVAALLTSGLTELGRLAASEPTRG